MKKLFHFLLIFLLLSGCSHSAFEDPIMETEKPELTTLQNMTEKQHGDFVLQIGSEKKIYKVNEEVKFIARLKYIGKLPEFRIFHAASPFYFEVKETTRDIYLPFAMDQPLLSTNLLKGEWLEGEYNKIGLFIDGDDDPNQIFNTELMKNPGYPEGEYEVKVTAKFYCADGEKKIDTEFSTESIKVFIRK